MAISCVRAVADPCLKALGMVARVLRCGPDRLAAAFPACLRAPHVAPFMASRGVADCPAVQLGKDQGFLHLGLGVAFPHVDNVQHVLVIVNTTLSLRRPLPSSSMTSATRAMPTRGGCGVPEVCVPREQRR